MLAYFVCFVTALVLLVELAVSMPIALIAQAPAAPASADDQIAALRKALGQAQQQLGASNRQLGACSGDLLTIQGQETAGDLVPAATVAAAVQQAHDADRAAFEKSQPGKTLDKDGKIVEKPKDK